MLQELATDDARRPDLRGTWFGLLLRRQHARCCPSHLDEGSEQRHTALRSEDRRPGLGCCRRFGCGTGSGAECAGRCGSQCRSARGLRTMRSDSAVRHDRHEAQKARVRFAPVLSLAATKTTISGRCTQAAGRLHNAPIRHLPKPVAPKRSTRRFRQGENET